MSLSPSNYRLVAFDLSNLQTNDVAAALALSENQRRRR
jgi:hypothetical protein